MWKKNIPKTCLLVTLTIQSGLEHQNLYNRNPNIRTDELRPVFFQENDTSWSFGITDATLLYNSLCIYPKYCIIF